MTINRSPQGKFTLSEFASIFGGFGAGFCMALAVVCIHGGNRTGAATCLALSALNIAVIVLRRYMAP